MSAGAAALDPGVAAAAMPALVRLVGRRRPRRPQRQILERLLPPADPQTQHVRHGPAQLHLRG